MGDVFFIIFLLFFSYGVSLFNYLILAGIIYLITNYSILKFRIVLIINPFISAISVLAMGGNKIGEITFQEYLASLAASFAVSLFIFLIYLVNIPLKKLREKNRQKEIEEAKKEMEEYDKFVAKEEEKEEKKRERNRQIEEARLNHELGLDRKRYDFEQQQREIEKLDQEILDYENEIKNIRAVSEVEETRYYTLITQVKEIEIIIIRKEQEFLELSDMDKFTMRKALK